MTREKTILIVEDSMGDFTLLTECLHLVAVTREYRIIHAMTLEKALLLKDAEEPALIFLDLRLPDSLGMETFTAINHVYPLSAIIVLSGLEDKTIALQSIHAGAQDYILKGDFDEKLLEKSIQYSLERKQNQQALIESNTRYEMASKATNDPIWDWDLTSGEIIWNDKVAVFGYPDAIVKNDAWRRSAIHKDDVDRVTRKLDQQLNNLSDTWSDHYRFKCADNSYRYIMDRGYILRKQSGIPYRMTGSMQDITAQVLLEEKLEEERTESQKDVLKAIIMGQEKEKNELGKELHDNINQILVTVKMYLEVARIDKSRSQEMVEQSYQHVSTVLNEIRNLSHSLSIPSLGSLSLNDALENMFYDMNAGNQLKIRYCYDAERDIHDKNKELALYRIVQEQLSNIIKYAKATQVEVTVGITKDQLHMTITDNGTGFDPAKTAKGIGLKNISNRVHVYSGTMELISSPGNGCTLNIMLPDPVLG
ncbi:MAG: response regulator [Chitinophagaceae bacterium]